MIIDTESAALPTTRHQALTLLGTWTSGLFATAVMLVVELRDLRPPQIWSEPGAWDHWASHHEPNELVAALVAPAALALVCALTVTVAVTGAAVAVATRRGRSVHCSDRWPAAAVGFVAAVTLLAAGPASASTGSGARAGEDVAERPVVELVGATAPTTISTTTTASAAMTTSAPTTTRVPTTSSTSTTISVPTTLPPSPSSAAGPTRATPSDLALPSPTTPDVTTVVVRQGDNLWRIAEQQVTAQPDLGPTVRYWLRLIDANSSRFVEPGNPSLILPGQVLELPRQ